jgi:Flp pilus assembly protein TadG
MHRTNILCCRRQRRTAVAAVELAVCLPAIVVIVFAAIESCSMIFVTQGLHAAAYEGARVAVQRDADTAQTIARAEEILSGHGITAATVTCNPAEISSALPGESVTVIVTVHCDANRISPMFFFSGRNLEGRTTMAKEG